MPYGGTVDGVKYLYAGNEVKPDATGSAGYDGRKIEIQGKAVEVAEGAVLDVSGGGELSGGAFVRGRGGSVDVLRYAMADANPGFGFSRSGNAVMPSCRALPATRRRSRPTRARAVRRWAGR